MRSATQAAWSAAAPRCPGWRCVRRRTRRRRCRSRRCRRSGRPSTARGRRPRRSQGSVSRRSRLQSGRGPWALSPFTSTLETSTESGSVEASEASARQARTAAGPVVNSVCSTKDWVSRRVQSAGSVLVGRRRDRGADLSLLVTASAGADEDRRQQQGRKQETAPAHLSRRPRTVPASARSCRTPGSGARPPPKLGQPRPPAPAMRSESALIASANGVGQMNPVRVRPLDPPPSHLHRMAPISDYGGTVA